MCAKDRLILGMGDRIVAQAEILSRNAERPVVWDQVIADFKARDDFGRKKYGVPLMTEDGRDTLQDAYEEALDLAVYLKKAILERNRKRASESIPLKQVEPTQCALEAQLEHERKA